MPDEEGDQSRQDQELAAVEEGGPPSCRVAISARNPACGTYGAHGVAMVITAQQHVVLSALEVRLKGGRGGRVVSTPRARRSSPVTSTEPLRVYCTRTEQEGTPPSKIWDWRGWLPVGSRVPEERGSSGALLRIPLEHPVPIAAGCSRTLYCFSPTEILVASSSRKLAVIGSDGTISVTARGGHSESDCLFLMQAELSPRKASLERAGLEYSRHASGGEAFERKLRRFDDRFSSLEELMGYRNIGFWCPHPHETNPRARNAGARSTTMLI